MMKRCFAFVLLMALILSLATGYADSELPVVNYSVYSNFYTVNLNGESDTQFIGDFQIFIEKELGYSPIIEEADEFFIVYLLKHILIIPKSVKEPGYIEKFVLSQDFYNEDNLYAVFPDSNELYDLKSLEGDSYYINILHFDDEYVSFQCILRRAVGSLFLISNYVENNDSTVYLNSKQYRYLKYILSAETLKDYRTSNSV